jgi:hypothetical protein
MLDQIRSLKTQISPQTIEQILPSLANVILKWPSPKRFPAIDLVRFAASKAHAIVAGFKFEGGNIISILSQGAELHTDAIPGRKELDTNALLALRMFVNLFEGQEGIHLMTSEASRVNSHEKTRLKLGPFGDQNCV